MKTRLAQSLRQEPPPLSLLSGGAAPDGYDVFIGHPEDAAPIVQFSVVLFPDNALDIKTARRLLRRGHVLAFGLTGRAGELAASCVLEFNIRQARIYINEIGVLDRHRGQGLGRWLFEAIERIAEHYGYRFIASHVAVDNKDSLSLHHHFGLLPERVERDYYGDGADAHYLRKRLR